jgi:acid phosphatase family membrane protein YuiD
MLACAGSGLLPAIFARVRRGTGTPLVVTGGVPSSHLHIIVPIPMPATGVATSIAMMAGALFR